GIRGKIVPVIAVPCSVRAKVRIRRRIDDVFGVAVRIAIRKVDRRTRRWGYHLQREKARSLEFVHGGTGLRTGRSCMGGRVARVGREATTEKGTGIPARNASQEEDQALITFQQILRGGAGHAETLSTPVN